MKRIGLLAVSWIVLILFESIPTFAIDLDIVPFARHCCVTDGHSSQVAFEYNKVQRAGIEVEKAADGRFIYGLQWSEERDIKEVRARFREGNNRQLVSIQYWFRNWPYPPPQMPAMEDPVDDPWQGKWLKAATNVNCRGPVCSYTFEPLSEAENPKANNLPGMNYRRTLKLRLVFTANPALEKVEVFSGSQEKQVELRLQLGAGETTEHTWDGRLQVYNGRLETVRLWNGAVEDTVGREHFHLITQGAAKGLLVNLAAAEPALPGSHDVTIVTLDAGDRTFSFAIPDLEKGPVYVPDFHVYVTLASEAREFSPSLVKQGEKIRRETGEGTRANV